MCGIAGIFSLRDSGARFDAALLERMNDTQVHRGPDEDGVHLEPGLGLAHRRLSIIDISSGHQPMATADQSVWVVYNGEIYNFQEIATELRALGHEFRTHCDTEVILYAWRQWGEACVDRFRGMFAFALWDRNRRVLFLARDRLGIKPLYYGKTADDSVVFGSELKALMAHPGLNRKLDPCAVEEYFGYGYVPEPRTIFKDSYKLPPGHTLTLKAGETLPEPRPYWDLRFEARAGLDEASLEGELRERIAEAVRIRLIAEVPLGAFLSGGVDSSAVVATMAGLSDDPVKTCSISFGEADFDESRYARQVAERYRTDHRVEQVDPADFSLVDQLATLYDEPYADSSALPTYRVCELAKRQVTVALSGDGGDENLAGYRRYRWHMYEERLRSRLPLGFRRGLFGTLGRVYPKADWAPRVFRAKSTFQALARDTVEGYFHSVSVLGDELRERLFDPQFKSQLQGYRAVEVLRGHARDAAVEDGLSLVQLLDLKTYLVGDILTKVDRASMAHSLEVRVPLLDHKLVEWLATLPSDLKLRGREGKYLLKRAMEPKLSKDILYRPKMGFGVPLASWFRGPLRQRVRGALLGERLADTGFFQQAFLRELVDQHERGLRDYSASIWALLMFDSFLGRIEA